MLSRAAVAAGGSAGFAFRVASPPFRKHLQRCGRAPAANMQAVAPTATSCRAGPTCSPPAGPSGRPPAHVTAPRCWRTFGATHSVWLAPCEHTGSLIPPMNGIESHATSLARPALHVHLRHHSALAAKQSMWLRHSQAAAVSRATPVRASRTRTRRFPGIGTSRRRTRSTS